MSAFILNEGAGTARNLVPQAPNVAVNNWSRNVGGITTHGQVVGYDQYAPLEFTGEGTEFSVVMLAVPQDTTQYQESGGYGAFYTGANGGYAIGFLPGGGPIYCLHQNNNLDYEGSNSAASTAASSGWTPNRLYNVACTLRLGDVSLLYVDGKLESTNSLVTPTINYESGKGIVIADNVDSEVTASYIYSRMLSAAEVQQLYIDPYCFLEPTPSWSRLMSSASSLFTSTLTATTSTFSATTSKATSKSTFASMATMAGAAAKATVKGITANASSFTGSILKTAAKVLTAVSSTASATVARATGKAISATAATNQATVTKATAHTETAQASNFSATNTKATSKPLTASTATFTATLVRNVGKYLTAAIDSLAGNLTGYRLGLVIDVAFTAVLSAMSGSTTKRTSHGETASTASMVGQATRSTSKALQAVSAGFSVIVGKGVAKTMTSAISLAGSVTKSTNRTLTAVMGGFLAVVSKLAAAISLPQRWRMLFVPADNRVMRVARERRTLRVPRRFD